MKSSIKVVILLIILISSCDNPEAVVEVDSFMLGDEKIVAGNQFRLTPLKDEMIKLKGEGFSINEFDFNCVLLSEENELERLFKGVIAIYLIGAIQKYSVPEFIEWPESVTEKEIKIEFPIFPGEAYSGEGFFHF